MKVLVEKVSDRDALGRVFFTLFVKMYFINMFFNIKILIFTC